MTKKEKIIVHILIYFTMVLVGVILNTYGLLNDNKQINKVAFNNILLKSAVVSFAILIVLVVSNYKKFKAINKE